MIIDKYRSETNFPYVQYFDNVDQYLRRQAYWGDVLNSIPNFDVSFWVPTIAKVDIKDDMLLGSMYSILSVEKHKEIIIDSASIEGLTNMIFVDNQPIDKAHIERASHLMEFTDEDIREMETGITLEDARKEAEEIWQPFSAYVDIYDGFIYNIPESEKQHPFERLILLSDISEESEPKARQALELFLQDGPAMERVNSVFSPDEDD